MYKIKREIQHFFAQVEICMCVLRKYREKNQAENKTKALWKMWEKKPFTFSFHCLIINKMQWARKSRRHMPRHTLKKCASYAENFAIELKSLRPKRKIRRSKRQEETLGCWCSFAWCLLLVLLNLLSSAQFSYRAHPLSLSLPVFHSKCEALNANAVSETTQPNNICEAHEYLFCVKNRENNAQTLFHTHTQTHSKQANENWKS